MPIVNPYTAQSGDGVSASIEWPKFKKKPSVPGSNSNGTKDNGGTTEWKKNFKLESVLSKKDQQSTAYGSNDLGNNTW